MMFMSNQHSPAEVLVDFALAAACGYEDGLPVDPPSLVEGSIFFLTMFYISLP